MRIGFSELLFIILLILALFSPDKLKLLSGRLREAFKNISEEKEQFQEEAKSAMETVDEVLAPVGELKQEYSDLKNNIADRMR